MARRRRRRRKNPSTAVWLMIGGGAVVGLLLLSRRAKAARGLPPGAKVKASGGVIAEVASIVTGKAPEFELVFPEDPVTVGKIKVDPSGVLMCVDPAGGFAIPRGNCEPRIGELDKIRRELGVGQ